MITAKCEMCGKIFCCNGDTICEAKNQLTLPISCYCKKCSKEKFGETDYGCVYYNYVVKEKVRFT
jgi:hypothetical protein